MAELSFAATGGCRLFILLRFVRPQCLAATHSSSPEDGDYAVMKVRI